MTLSNIILVIGGVGLFLLGMTLLTEGLKSAAGDALQKLLSRFTRGTGTAVLSGAGITALIQSSSATTVATIGFVSAGMLTFENAIGVMMGASFGTTITGWLVSLFGLKLKIGLLALPLVGAGAFLRLLSKGRGRRASIGMAIAGFGVIFIGIDTLQQGMQEIGAGIDPGLLPSGHVLGLLALFLIGLAMVVVMQSSSAAVATTLTALHTGTIDLTGAAMLVIGHSVGTTVTAGIASIGASVPARRTAMSHIMFNTFAGAIAFLLLPVFLFVANRIADPVESGAMLLAAFHSSFNLLGILILFPFIPSFAKLITRLVPERGPALTRNLDQSLTTVPPVAVEAARRAIIDTAFVVVETLRSSLAAGSRRPQNVDPLAGARAALSEIRRFLGAVRTSGDAPGEHDAHLAALHAMDHLDSLTELCAETARAAVMREQPGLHSAGRTLAGALQVTSSWLRGDATAPALETTRLASASLTEQRPEFRRWVLGQTARGGFTPEAADRLLDAMVWLERSGYHTWRLCHHLQPTGRHRAEEGLVAEEAAAVQEIGAAAGS